MIHSSSRFRLGAVSYLNTKPLVHKLSRLAPWADLTLEVPSRLADGLRNGSYDVALIPSITYFQDPQLRIVSDACIGCLGPVWSVKIFSRKPLDSIHTLALDEGSRTSIALSRILLAEKFGLRPELSPFPLDADAQELPTDAVLMIGDRSMHGPPPTYRYQWDLGEQWRLHTGLPFVFAMWVARPDVRHPELESALAAARDSGLRHLHDIARREHRAAGLSQPDCYRYLRHNLHFHLGPQQRQGLELFRQLAVREGLAPPIGGLARSRS